MLAMVISGGCGLTVCSEMRTVSARLVLKTCIPVQLFAVEFANRSPVLQLISCAVPGARCGGPHKALGSLL